MTETQNLTRKCRNHDQLGRMSGHSLETPTKPSVDEPLVDGYLKFRNFHEGLSMHATSGEELSDVSMFVEMTSGLSFNLVFEGKVDFSLAGNRFLLGGSQQPVECTAIVLNRQEVMTRHMKQGQRVTKVNVFVEKHWLEDRLVLQEERKRLEKWFQYHGRVFHWSPSSTLVKLAKTQLSQNSENELENSLVKEAEIIRLLGQLLDEFDQQCPTEKTPEDQPGSELGSLSMRRQIDIGLERNLTLEKIADSLRMSVSTLQRKFKATYGMTVMEYVRCKRLEAAKIGLVRDGLSIGEAAYLAGYNHPSSFVTAFKRHFKMSPSNFKNNHLGNSLLKKSQ